MTGRIFIVEICREFPEDNCILLFKNVPTNDRILDEIRKYEILLEEYKNDRLGWTISSEVLIEND